MTRDRVVPFAVLGAGAFCLVLAEFAGGFLPAALTATLCFAGMFFVPGLLLLSACRLTGDVGWLERPGICFALSLGMLAVATLPIPLQGWSLHAALPILFLECLIAAAIAAYRDPAPELIYRDGGPTREPLPLGLLGFATVALMVGAWLYTETGSIDRWWYLAYIRDYVNSGSIDGAEPFLGSGNVLPRFAWNTWILSFALWAKISSADPTALYERYSVLLLAPVAVSAAVFMGRAVFDTWRLAFITGLCSVLLWTSGSLLPALTRLPEDKLLATLILVPILVGAVVRAAVSGRNGWNVLHRRNWIPVAAVASLAAATVHPFAYGLGLVMLLPFVVLFGVTRQTHRGVAVALVAVLLVSGALSYSIGSAARDAVIATGASIATPDHPVVRVHMSQDRLVDVGFGKIVSPKLLLHPLVLLGFLGLLPLLGRSFKERYLITPATFFALSVAFLAPLTALAGTVVTPWMVYRILWAIPFALLLAVFIDEAGRLTRLRPTFVVAALALATFPWLRDAVAAHERPERQILSSPKGGEIAELVTAIGKLPDDAVIVAAPRLSERLPALTGKHVLASSDRGTVVFSGDRALGEKRLQARTAALIGLWRPAEGVPDPTHIVFAPGAPAERYCEEAIFESEGYRLCEFSTADPIPGVRLHEAPDDRVERKPGEPKQEGLFTIGLPHAPGEHADSLQIECTPAPESVFRTVQWKDTDPWAAAAPGTTCTLTPSDSEAMPLFTPRELQIDPFLGRAAEEVVVSATAWRDGVQRWNLRTRQRVKGDARLEYTFPQTRIDKLELRVTPAYMPFLKLGGLVVTFEDAAKISGEDDRVASVDLRELAEPGNDGKDVQKDAESPGTAVDVKKPAVAPARTPGDEPTKLN
jgi:hypothetical protein